jgi:hypothetical protein
MTHTMEKKQDLTQDMDCRGDYAMFIEEKHFTSEWELDSKAKSETRGLMLFRVIRNGVEQSSHGWIDNGEIVQWG